MGDKEVVELVRRDHPAVQDLERNDAGAAWSELGLERLELADDLSGADHHQEGLVTVGRRPDDLRRAGAHDEQRVGPVALGDYGSTGPVAMRAASAKQRSTIVRVEHLKEGRSRHNERLPLRQMTYGEYVMCCSVSPSAGRPPHQMLIASNISSPFASPDASLGLSLADELCDARSPSHYLGGAGDSALVRL